MKCYYKKSKGRYGAPKLHILLLRAGFKLSLKTTQRLMSQLGLKSIIVKKEEVYRNIYKTYEDAKLAIFSYIEGWYNKRLHSAINYRTPNEFVILAKNAA